MKKEKLNLNQLQVASFVVNIDSENQKTIAGGFYTIIIMSRLQCPSVGCPKPVPGSGGIYREWKQEEEIWEN